MEREAVRQPSSEAELASGSFEAWYQVVAPRVSRAVLAITADPSRTEDIVAEAFARAWDRWGRGLSASPTADGWVWTVAINLTKRRGRLREHPADLIVGQQIPAPCAALPDIELHRAIRRLPLRQRQVVALRYFADLSEREIAAVLDLSEGGVSASLVKARRRLRSDVGGPDGQL
ncbi:MAG: sigma-70 family RNA polymerase sigma factor [Acidimicrobiia bacterium]|nr:sigma-70 family RNA polymerase sigma factor [Acidimicrobiia bacterium]